LTHMPKDGHPEGSIPTERQWMGKLLLSAPASFRALLRVPLLGGMIHKLSHCLIGSDEVVWTQIQGGPAKGLWIELNPRTGQDYLRGNVEIASLEVLKERLRPGAVFYDLGANIGLFSLLAARIMGPAGKVFSFEPDPKNAARLRRNADHNEFSNITVVQAGVWSSSGKQTFWFADASSPDRGVGRFTAEEYGTNGVALECVALDNFVEGVPLPDAIKCDVEGAEVEVLRGATRILREVRPWIICELHSEENALAVQQLLRAAGYSIELVDATHILAVAK
jgi:FkbM family methyltransferase